MKILKVIFFLCFFVSIFTKDHRKLVQSILSKQKQKLKKLEPRERNLNLNFKKMRQFFEMMNSEEQSSDSSESSDSQSIESEEPKKISKKKIDQKLDLIINLLSNQGERKFKNKIKQINFYVKKFEKTFTNFESCTDLAGIYENKKALELLEKIVDIREKLNHKFQKSIRIDKKFMKYLDCAKKVREDFASDQKPQEDKVKEIIKEVEKQKKILQKDQTPVKIQPKIFQPKIDDHVDKTHENLMEDEVKASVFKKQVLFPGVVGLNPVPLTNKDGKFLIHSDQQHRMSLTDLEVLREKMIKENRYDEYENLPITLYQYEDQNGNEIPPEKVKDQLNDLYGENKTKNPMDGKDLFGQALKLGIIPKENGIKDPQSPQKEQEIQIGQIPKQENQPKLPEPLTQQDKKDTSPIIPLKQEENKNQKPIKNDQVSDSQPPVKTQVIPLKQHEADHLIKEGDKEGNVFQVDQDKLKEFLKTKQTDRKLPEKVQTTKITQEGNVTKIQIQIHDDLEKESDCIEERSNKQIEQDVNEIMKGVEKKTNLIQLIQMRFQQWTITLSSEGKKKSLMIN